jgi:GxxExxY protein
VADEEESKEEHREHKEHKALPDGLDSLSKILVESGLKVHKTLGPGLLESTYEHCLAHELHRRGVSCQRQVALPITYEGERIEAGYRLDLVAENTIIIEVKATETIPRLHEAQLLTYLKMSGLRVGFLMNFNVVLFTQSLRRLIR